MKLFGNTGNSQYRSGKKRTTPLERELPEEEDFMLPMNGSASESAAPEDNGENAAEKGKLELPLTSILDEELSVEDPEQPPETDKTPEEPEAEKELTIEGLPPVAPAEAPKEPEPPAVQESPEAQPKEEAKGLNIAEESLSEIEEEQIKNELFRELNLIIEERREDLTDDQPEAITGRPPKKEERHEEQPEAAAEDETDAENEEAPRETSFRGHAIGLVVLTVSLVILGFVVYMVADKLLA